MTIRKSSLSDGWPYHMPNDLYHIQCERKGQTECIIFDCSGDVQKGRSIITSCRIDMRAHWKAFSAVHNLYYIISSRLYSHALYSVQCTLEMILFYFSILFAAHAHTTGTGVLRKLCAPFRAFYS